ncbi:MAG: GNAT family N-acetyltransferase [Ginsengibacter sp.]
MSDNSSVQVRNINLPNDIDFVKELWIDYLTWGNDKMQMLYGVHPHNPKESVTQDIKLIDKFQPTHGCIMLAFYDQNACGVGCLKRMNEEIAEIKRIYVNPAFRRIGAGRGILESLLKAAKGAGYKKVRLDSLKFMEAAHSLYRSFGFKDILAYEESEIPESFRQYLMFMELDIA